MRLLLPVLVLAVLFSTCLVFWHYRPEAGPTIENFSGLRKGMSQRQVLNRLGEPTSRIGINNVTNWYWEQLDRKIVVTFSKSSPVVALHGRMEVVGGPSISLRQDQEILDLIRDLLP